MRRVAQQDEVTAGRSGRKKKRDKVIDAAARVFAERGYHGASTQDIADFLGMRQASLYYYFPSKEAALEEVCAVGAAGFLENAEAIARSDAAPPDKLRALLVAHVMPLSTKADYIQTFLQERKWLPTESRRRIGHMSRRIEAIFERVIRDGMRQGDFRKEANPRLTTLGFLGMLNAVPAWYSQEKQPLEEIAGTLADLAIGGLAEPQQG